MKIRLLEALRSAGLAGVAVFPFVATALNPHSTYPTADKTISATTNKQALPPVVDRGMAGEVDGEEISISR